MKKTYPSDLNDKEYNLLKDLIPEAKYGGRPKTTNVLNAIFYVLKSGCQWRMLPKDFRERYTNIFVNGKQ